MCIHVVYMRHYTVVTKLEALIIVPLVAWADGEEEPILQHTHRQERVKNVALSECMVNTLDNLNTL